MSVGTSFGKHVVAQSGPGAQGNRVSHIFRGIPEHRFDPNASPQFNLHAMRADLLRLNIRIDPSAVIANSTLGKLMRLVNRIMSPTPELPDGLRQMFEFVMQGATVSAEAESIVDDMTAAVRNKRFNISIGAGTHIGERVKIPMSVSIGSHTTVEKTVDLCHGVQIGDHCLIGAGSYINWDCSIGDHAAVLPSAVFDRETVVPPYAWVVHDYEDSYMARIMV